MLQLVSPAPPARACYAAMPEERFGDLDGDRRRGGGEPLEEEDRTRPAPDVLPARPEVPRRGNKYAWAGGFVVLMGIAVLVYTTTLPNTRAGLRGPERGKLLPAFAAPLATAEVECADDEDGCAPNVCQRASGCNGSSGTVPACEVRGEGIFNVCELRERPLVMTFLSTAGADCEPQVDRVERVRGEFPGVHFAAVVSGEGRETVEQIVRRRAWGLPVAVDIDGKVQDLYGLGVCPSTVFSSPGGEVFATELGNLTEQQLRDRVRKLLTAG